MVVFISPLIKRVKHMQTLIVLIETTYMDDKQTTYDLFLDGLMMK
jgi:hypothetical protein